MCKYKCQEGTWFTQGDCPDDGSSDCPLLFPKEKCSMTDEFIEKLRIGKSKWEEERAAHYIKYHGAAFRD